jgi:hypothetical protein
MHLEKQLSKNHPPAGQNTAASGLFGWISEGNKTFYMDLSNTFIIYPQIVNLCKLSFNC